jgi:hypothetical protein
LVEEYREGRRPVKEDAGVPQAMLFQKLAKLFAYRMAKRNGVPCITNGLCPWDGGDTKAKNRGRMPVFSTYLHAHAVVQRFCHALADRLPDLRCAAPDLGFYRVECGDAFDRFRCGW